jgi:monoamine oxidase
LNGGSYTLTAAEREEKSSSNLARYMSRSGEICSLSRKVWREEVLTFLPMKSLSWRIKIMDILIIKPFINNKLYISGAETASINPGYMDGALNAAYYIAAQF